jgi:hypothetical protein
MNTRHAAGRNWQHHPDQPRPAGRPRRVNDPQRAAHGPTLAEQLRSRRAPAPGRNWARAPRQPRRVHLDTAPPVDAFPAHPARECFAADRDQPYQPARPSWRSTAPFTPLQYARLLLLRGQLQNQRLDRLAVTASR